MSAEPNSNPTQQLPPEDSKFVVQMQRFGLFWTLVLYASMGLALFGLAGEYPAMLGDPWVWLVLGLLVVFSILYHFVYYPVLNNWPMRLGRAVFYFGTQSLILLLLTSIYVGFVGLGWALLGQIVSCLRPRHWPFPFLAVFVASAWGLDFVAEAVQGDWWSLLSFLFTILIYAAIGFFVYLLFEQRWRLAALLAEVKQSKAALERSAMQAEELAILRERTRLAREMHDSLGHALVLVNVKLEAAQRLYNVDQLRGAAELEATRELVRETMAELRRSLVDLRAPLPAHRDLPAALGRLASEFSARGSLAVSYRPISEQILVDDEQAEALYRVAREALSNVQRHAAAASASIVLNRCNGTLRLQVIDDGSGIRQEDLQRPGHYGIIGMRELIHSIGGELRVVARPEGGTLVEASIPHADDPRTDS